MIDILPFLDGVRETGPNKYVARCPAHDDRSPSLSVRITPDEKILMHCFGGCDIEAIVSALGLTISDLMPPGDNDSALNRAVNRRRSSNRLRSKSLVSAKDALIAMDHIALIIAVIAADIIAHREIDEETWELLAKSVERIGAGRDACCSARHRP